MNHVITSEIAGNTFYFDQKYLDTYSKRSKKYFHNRCIYNVHLYEQDELRLIKSFLSPSSTVLELGACIGVVSCMTNKLLSDPTRHVVVEGNRFWEPYLEYNASRNGCLFQTRFVDALDIDIHDLESELGLKFDVIISDIEGHEYQFFKNNAAYLSNLKAAFIEWHKPFSKRQSVIQSMQQAMLYPKKHVGRQHTVFLRK